MKKQSNMHRVFAIYAELTDEDSIIYVGLSRMGDIKRIMRYYRNESKLTAEFFEPGIAARIVFLEDRYMPKGEAYMYQIAWMRYFFEKNYDLVFYSKPYEDCLDLHGEAKQIYQRLLKIPLKEAFRRCQMPRETDVEDTVAENPTEFVTERISVRVTRQEQEAFTTLCKKHQLTQRQCFQVLLSHVEGIDQEVEVIRRLNQQSSEQLLEIERLKEAVQNSKKNARKSYCFIKKGIQKYIYLCNDARMIEVPGLRCLHWDEFVRCFPNRQAYDYPSTEGHFCFQIENMCYGKGQYAAVFLYGINCETGKPMKLRFYPRDNYCGVDPVGSVFFTKGAHFLVGCRYIYPGVADMIYAYPLPELDGSFVEGKDAVDSVEQLIRDATLRTEDVEY